MSNVRHIMLDIETTGTSVQAPILQIAGAIMIEGHAEPFINVRVDRHAQLTYASEDQATLDWWKRQPEEIRIAVFSGTTHIQDALIALARIITKEDIVITQGPHFDIAILSYHMREWHIEQPWHYRNIRDLRQMRAQFNGRTTKHAGAHDAMDDAMQQMEDFIELVSRHPNALL